MYDDYTHRYNNVYVRLYVYMLTRENENVHNHLMNRD